MKRIFFLFIFLFFYGNNALYAQKLEGPIIDIFHAAGEFYKNKEYDKSVDHYEEILLGGIEGGHIFFNLGNSYYKLGKIGKARLNYERAMKFIPRDSDLKYNYNYLLTFIPLGDGPKKVSLFKKIVSQFSRLYTLDEMVTVIVFLFIALLGFAALSLYRRWSVKTKAWVFLTLGVFLIVFFI